MLYFDTTHKMAAPRGGKRRRTKEEHDDIADEADIAEEMAAAGLISVIPGKEVKNTVRRSSHMGSGFVLQNCLCFKFRTSYLCRPASKWH